MVVHEAKLGGPPSICLPLVNFKRYPSPIHVPTPPGIKKHPTFVSLSVWLQLMVCKTCGRPLTSLELCAGCRSLARTRWLWETRLKGGDDLEPLAILRNCEGALTDIGEVRHCREAEAAPGSRRDGKVPPKGTPKAEAKETPGTAPEAAGVPVPAKEGHLRRRLRISLKRKRRNQRKPRSSNPIGGTEEV